MLNLTDEQLTQIDDLISQDDLGRAFMKYREITKTGINEALDALSERLQTVSLPPPEDPTEHAFQKLAAIENRVVVIEATWDADTFSAFFIKLSAIVDGPSNQHPRFTDWPLCFINRRWVATQNVQGKTSDADIVEAAAKLGAKLAEAVNVPFYITSQTANDTIRWWDRDLQSAE